MGLLNDKINLMSDGKGDNLEKIRSEFQAKLDEQSQQNLKLQDYIMKLVDKVESQKDKIDNQEE